MVLWYSLMTALTKCSKCWSAGVCSNGRDVRVCAHMHAGMCVHTHTHTHTTYTHRAWGSHEPFFYVRRTVG